MYLDSIAPWWAGRVSVRAEHSAHCHHPLVCLDDDPQLLLMPAFTLLAPYLDMMGSGEGSTANFAATYPYQRTLAYHKPLSILDYDLMKPEIPLDRKAEAMLAGFPYAVFPGTAPFDDPKLYNTMRPLYRRYMPAFFELAKAGWEPITYARVAPREVRLRARAASGGDAKPEVLLERYGPTAGGPVYLALRNPTEAPVTARVSLSQPGFPARGEAASRAERAQATELFSGSTLRPAEGAYTVQLPPKKCAALRFAAR